MKTSISIFNIIISFLTIILYNLLYYDSSTNYLIHTHNIFILPCFFAIFHILQKANKYYKKLTCRKWIILLLGFIYSIFFILGTHIQLHGNITFSNIYVWLSIPIFAYVISCLLIFFKEKLLPLFYKELIQKEYKLCNIFYDKITFFPLWGIIFILWIPVFLTCYPGIFSYDAINQCSQIGETIQLSSHHPIIHTILLGGCVQLGRTYFHSPNLGMAIYSLLQMLINSGIFAFCLITIKKWCRSTIVFSICTVFFIVMPFNSLFAVCATKDAIFGPLFLLLFIFVCKLTLSTDFFFAQKRNSVAFIIIAFLLLIFRNNMLYAFIVSIPMYMLIYRKYWKNMIIILVTPLLLLLMYQRILYPILDVSPGNSREAYSVIMQQYANVYNYGNVNESQKELLLKLMDDADWKKYESRRADAVKDHFKTEIFEENIIDYVKLWIQLGLKNPSQYINAFLNLTYGYWYPNDLLPDTTTYRKYIEVYCSGDITFDSKFPWLLYQFQKFGMESSYQKLPVISMLFSPGLYLWILLYLSASSFYERKTKFSSLILLPLTLFLTLLLGPVALLRYLYPIILCVPIIISIYDRI